MLGDEHKQNPQRLRNHAHQKQEVFVEGYENHLILEKHIYDHRL